ncbi:hypothetical protein [Nonomuraea sp. NPDC049141]|uniref:hypothetical protein n=1 Tax=unclassified Nonomuraea TaxID=2593643 RepID=UPI0033DEEDEE
MRAIIAVFLWLNPLSAAVQPRFPVPMDLCAAVDEALVKRLVPDAKARHDGLDCAWTSRSVGLTVKSVSANGKTLDYTSEALHELHTIGKDVEPWDRTSAQAHEAYRKRLADDLRPSRLTIWQEPDIGVTGDRRRGVTTTAARAVQGVGDEAHEVDYLTPRTKRPERVYVVFRAGNLLLEVAYTGIDGRVSAERLRQGAVSVSSRMAATLGRMSPPEQTPATTPGTYAETPIACAMLTPAQIKQLKAGDMKATGYQPDRCEWGLMFADPLLTVQFSAPQRGPAGDGIAQAKEMFAGWRTQESTAADIGDIGDEAFASKSAVVFRKTNLIGLVTATPRARAEQAARWIVAALP